MNKTSHECLFVILGCRCRLTVNGIENIKLLLIVLKHTKAEQCILPFVPVIRSADGVSEKHAAIFKNGVTDRKK